ncbi:MAG: CHAT domain-containing tetratricopeptide repeat protein [Cyanobacteria bacterium J06635_1]
MSTNRTGCWANLGLALVYSVGVMTISVGVSVSIPRVVLAQTPNLQADDLFRQALGHYQNQQFEDAIAAWQQALQLYESAGADHHRSVTLNFLAAAHIVLGQMIQAGESLRLALTLVQQVGDIPLQAEILGNFGIVYRGQGQYVQAIEVYHQSLGLMRQLGDHRGEAHVLGLLGNAHESLGEYEQALDYHGQSLAIAQEAPDDLSEATALNNLGAIQARLGNYAEAIDYYQRSQRLSVARDDFEGLAFAFNNLGSAYHAQGNLQQATEYYQNGLRAAQNLQNQRLEGEILGSLGLIYSDSANLEQALDYLERSLAIATATANPQATATALNNLGHTLYEAGQFEAAESRLYAAIESLESLRPGLDDANQISLFDTHVLTYNLLQQVLVAQGKVEAALEVAERGRARAFVELVASRSDPAQSPTNTLVSEAPNIDQIRQIAQEQQATLVEYTLVPDDSFKFQGKQRGTADRLYIWVVQPSGEVDFRQVELQSILQEKDLTLTNLVQTARDRSGIRGESDTRNWATLRPGDRVRREGDLPEWEPYEVTAVDPQAGTVTVSHPNIFLPNPVLSIDEVTKVNTGFAPTFQRGPYWQDLHQLMIEPIVDLLPSDPTARVVFIPQEQLFLVPFPALQAEDESHLIEHHTILTAPAIQILALTAESVSATEPSFANSRIANPLIVGNPSPMPQALPELPHSATEANGIAEILSTAPLIGESASEASIKQQLSSARLIHLATHGFFNESNPLQGSLALAPSKDEDGFLTAEEVLSYPLTAELVVLSACDTGRGEITGDGVIGLSRSFIAAGADNVLVSLWQVPDDATAELMIEFYRQRQQFDNAQALRQAMLATMESHPDPNDWAAFTLIGAIN